MDWPAFCAQKKSYGLHSNLGKKSRQENRALTSREEAWASNSLSYRNANTYVQWTPVFRSGRQADQLCENSIEKKEI